MADKGYTMSDILPLGVSLNIPPFLGAAAQMPPEDVVKTRLRIHIKHVINKSKNFHIWDCYTPKPLWRCESNVACLCISLQHPRSNHIKLT